MQKLKQIINDPDSPAGRVFDASIQILIILSMVAYAIETIPNLSPQFLRLLVWFENFSLLIFTGEYLLRVAVASPRRSYVLSFFGIIDLIAILPFFFSAGMDLRTVRTFRLLRLFRVLKLARYNSAARRFHLALSIAKEELVLFLGVTLILLYLAAVGIHHFESDAQPEKFASVFDCLWWAVATLTTVGYGDVYPITVGGKVFTFVILLIGLGVISIPAGLLASALAKARQMEEKEREEKNRTI